MEFKIDYVDFTLVTSLCGIPSDAKPRAIARVGFTIEHPKGPIRFNLMGFISDKEHNGRMVFGETRDVETFLKKQVVNPEKDGTDLWTPFIQATINKYWKTLTDIEIKPGTWYRVKYENNEPKITWKDRTGA